MAMLLAANLMLEYLGETDSAQHLESALAEVIQEGKVKTYDMAGTSTTLEVGQEIAKKLS